MGRKRDCCYYKSMAGTYDGRDYCALGLDIGIRCNDVCRFYIKRTEEAVSFLRILEILNSIQEEANRYKESLDNWINLTKGWIIIEIKKIKG